MGHIAGSVLLVSLLLGAWICPLSAQMQARSAELEPHAGLIDGNYAMGGGVQFNVSQCMGLAGTLDAVVDAGGYSELFSSANLLYGLWYCCIPAYYVRFVYLTAGAGTYHRIGKGKRLGDPCVNAGAGGRIQLNEKLGLHGEVRDFIVLGDTENRHLWAYRIGLHFIL